MVYTKKHSNDTYTITGKLSAIFFIAAIFISLSPLFNYTLGISGNFVFLFFCFLFLLLNLEHDIPRNLLFIVFVIVFSSGCIALFWQNPKFLTLSLYCSLSLYISNIVYNKYLDMVIKYMTVLLLVVSMMAWLGFFYALNGGESIFDIKNPDGRSAFFYISTMTNFRVGNIIRPAGFFDEPGALSFFICMLVFFRDALDYNKIVTFLLLFLGLITFSVAHIIFCVLFLLFSTRISIKIKGSIFIALIIFCISAFSLLSNIEVIDKLLMSRFELNSDGSISGDNRTGRFLNAINLIIEYPKLLLFGLDELCILGDDFCVRKYGAFGENILSPLVMYGFFNSMYFYFIIFSLLCFSYVRSDGSFGFLNVAIIALLFQRPYAYSYGYSAIISLCLFVGVFGGEYYERMACFKLYNKRKRFFN